jgi:hypothetical protein
MNHVAYLSAVFPAPRSGPLQRSFQNKWNISTALISLVESERPSVSSKNIGSAQSLTKMTLGFHSPGHESFLNADTEFAVSIVANRSRQLPQLLRWFFT